MIFVRCECCNKKVDIEDTIEQRLTDDINDIVGYKARICQECKDYFEREKWNK